MSRGVGSLYLCYLPLDEPLVETQVVPYLEGLATAGHQIHLLTYETGRLSRREAQASAARLSNIGITWHRARYHKRPSLPATILDAVWGGVRASLTVRRHRLDVVHARVHVPAVSALIASRLTGAALIFDVRGLMAEEYVDAGRWRAGGWPFRITKAVERRAVEHAEGIVVLTEGGRRALLGERAHPNLEVIPCCVNPAPFRAAWTGRSEVRARLGIGARPVVVYAGKFTGWYAEREMVEFFTVARDEIPGLHFLVLTQSDPDLMRTEFATQGVSPADYTLEGVRPERMPEMLAAADFGLSFVRPLPSKVASSPTKNAEYLAAGLPFVATAGVGGTDDIAAQTDAVVLIDRFESTEYERAIREIRRLLAEPGVRERCASVAERMLSMQRTGIPRYCALYARLEVAAGAVPSATQPEFGNTRTS